MTARYWQRGKAAALATGIVTSVVLSCSLVHASDRDYKEGPGFKVGLLEIHPGLALRGGYDSNLFSSEGARRGRAEVGTALITLTPHLNISTRGLQRSEGGEGTVTAPPKLRLSMGVAGSLLWYSAPQAPGTNFGVDFGGNVEILPERPVGMVLDASYERSIRPFTEQVGQDQNYVNNKFNVGALAKFQSQGGVLVSTVGFRPKFNFFGQDTPFTFLNNMQYTVPLNLAWKFLPHSAMLYDGEFSKKHYVNDVQLNDSVLYTDSTQFRSRIGVNTAITKAVSVQLMAGAAFGFYDDVPLATRQLDEFQEPLGQAMLTWGFGARQSKLELSYEHEIDSSLVGGWLKHDRGAAKLKLNVVQQFSIGAQVAAGYYQYGPMLQPNGARLGNNFDRDDTRVEFGTDMEYRVLSWLSLLAEFQFTQVFTDFEYETRAGGTMLIIDPASYQKFEVYGGIRAHY